MEGKRNERESANRILGNLLGLSTFDDAALAASNVPVASDVILAGVLLSCNARTSMIESPMQAMRPIKQF